MDPYVVDGIIYLPESGYKYDVEKDEYSVIDICEKQERYKAITKWNYEQCVFEINNMWNNYECWTRGNFRKKCIYTKYIKKYKDRRIASNYGGYFK